jgi:lysine 2,3-aminomutase
MDTFTSEFLDGLTGLAGIQPEPTLKKKMRLRFEKAMAGNKTQPILVFFTNLAKLAQKQSINYRDLGIGQEELEKLAARHEEIDEHGVTLGGRLGQARPIVQSANERVAEYMSRKDQEAPSGIQLWERMLENKSRIMASLSMSEADWTTYEGQLRYRIDDMDTLAKCIDLSAEAVAEVTRVTKDYRMRLTPYYASLILPDKVNDPVLLQSVPTAEMVDNVGEEIPPVAADHSPARLIDQFYPRVVTIKATNMCAMYCTHCLRIAHIGKKDRIYSQTAYED